MIDKPQSPTKIPKPPKTPELASAEDHALRCLRERNYEGAVRGVAMYEAKQPTPRGIGIDWSNPTVYGQVAGLAAIFTLPSAAGDDVRLAAAMMYLWGVSKPYRRWLAREANGDQAARELVLDAYAAEQGFYYRDAHERFGMGLDHPAIAALLTRVAKRQEELR